MTSTPAHSERRDSHSQNGSAHAFFKGCARKVASNLNAVENVESVRLCTNAVNGGRTGSAAG